MNSFKFYRYQRVGVHEYVGDVKVYSALVYSC